MAQTTDHRSPAQHHNDHAHDEHGEQRDGRIDDEKGHGSDVALALVQLDVLLGMVRLLRMVVVVLLLLVLLVLVVLLVPVLRASVAARFVGGPMVRDHVLGVVRLAHRLEHGHVFQLGEIERRLLVRCCRPNRYQPAITYEMPCRTTMIEMRSSFRMNLSNMDFIKYNTNPYGDPASIACDANSSPAQRSAR